MDDIELGGFTPVNVIRGRDVLFLANFENNGAIQSQMSALIVLCESFIRSLTVYLPFYPHGTMERVLKVSTTNKEHGRKKEEEEEEKRKEEKKKKKMRVGRGQEEEREN